MLNLMGQFEYHGDHRRQTRAEQRLAELEKLVVDQAKRIAELEIQLKEKQDAAQL